ncbi:SRPBCC family protein [Planococcus sp. YIM B11945]|uniref:SRPBCC family protein n=1 Tax=Planococcus sp. YIM B11945 TaxID=3435410 RepID=UPI003D7EE340
MDNLINEPIVTSEMLIRKPLAEVFEAFINPDITTKFWFTKSSGRMQTGKLLTWEWQMYGASAEVDVTEIVENERIAINWGDADAKTSVEWTFASLSDSETFVSIVNTGFTGSSNDKVMQAIDSMGGFTILLCGCKAYLEHGIELNLIADKAPQANIR